MSIILKTNESREIHLFTIFQVLLLAISMVCCLIGVIIKLTTSQNTHDISLASVIRTSMDFFYENPIGRILNRFTKDTDVLDDELGRVFKFLSTMLLVTLLSVTLSLTTSYF